MSRKKDKDCGCGGGVSDQPLYIDEDMQDNWLDQFDPQSAEDWTPKDVLTAKLHALAADRRALKVAVDTVVALPQDRDAIELEQRLLDAIDKIEDEILVTVDDWEQL